MNFKDYFSDAARSYAQFRPTYPPELFAYLASLAPGDALAWDCATGNGQTAIALTPYFSQIIATDGSTAQLAAAASHPRIEYRQAVAENSGLEAATIDLITVSQALHWFDLDAFYAEAQRVLRPRGVIAAWCYELFQIAPAIDELTIDFYQNVVGAYWTPERKLVETGYADLPFSFAELAPPAFYMRAEWTLTDLLGYVGTWSATRNYIRANEDNPVEKLAEKLSPLWGAAETRREVAWQLNLRVGRKS